MPEVKLNDHVKKQFMSMALPRLLYPVNAQESILEQVFSYLSRKVNVVFPEIAFCKVTVITVLFPLLDALCPIIHCGGEANGSGSCLLIHIFSLISL